MAEPANDLTKTKTSSPDDKPFYKKWWFWAIVGFVVIAAIAGLGGKQPNEEAAKDETSDTTVQEDEGSLTDPELEKINFSVSKVRNDTTGNWRVSVISEPIVMSDHAVAYYQKYIKDDNEVHAIVNFNKNTTTKIMKGAMGITVTTYEYVEDEEHDAKKLFSGKMLTEKYYDPKTGEEIKI